MALFAIEVLVLVGDLAAFHLIPDVKGRWLLDLNLEANIPTWVSTTQALFVAGAAYLLSSHHAKQNERFPRFAWLAIAGFFLYIAVDDASEMHERFATMLNTAMQNSHGSSWYKVLESQFASYHWQFFFMPLFGIVGVLMTLFLWRALGGFKGWLFYAGLGFYANAVLLDYFDPFFEIYEAMSDMTGVRPEVAV